MANATVSTTFGGDGDDDDDDGDTTGARFGVENVSNERPIVGANADDDDGNDGFDAAAAAADGTPLPDTICDRF